MRFLYADSEPFPLGYDFLDTLERFVKGAARAVAEEAEVQQLHAQMAQARRASAGQGHALSAYVNAVENSSRVALAKSAEVPLVRTFAAEVDTFLRQGSERARAAEKARVEQATQAAAARAEALRRSVRESLETFFLHARLDLALVSARMKLVEGTYEVEGRGRLANDIEVVFTVPAERLEDWSHPRKVSSLVGEMELQIGVKKKFLRRDLTREVVTVTDHTIVRAEVRDQRASIQLSRRPDRLKDVLELTLWLEDKEMQAQIVRPERADETPFPAVAEDLSKLDTLWRAVLDGASATVKHRSSVRSLLLGGQDVFEHNRVLPLVDRMVGLFAPIVAEIARRSPSPDELSLKAEAPDGRREEIYLRKQELAEALADLDGNALQHFAPLEVFPEIEVVPA